MTFFSKKCNKCALFGNHGSYRNMVYEKDALTIQKKNKSIMIKSNLNCISFVIYAAICIKCGESYVGQTRNSYIQDGTII